MNKNHSLSSPRKERTKKRIGRAKFRNARLRGCKRNVWTSFAALAIAISKEIGKTLLVKIFMPTGLIAICCLVVFSNFQLVGTEEIAVAQTPIQLSPSRLPPAQPHPLPPKLAQWQDNNSSNDYFSQVKPTRVGYLLWSQFPVKVYVERPPDMMEESAESSRFQQWVQAVLKAVQEWNRYFPLTVVEQQSMADIAILRSLPPLNASFNRNTGEFQLPRARSAQTRYELYTSQSGQGTSILSHRCTIQLSPAQSDNYIQAAARHELGHALGIWGHSPLETDALYFSQVRNPPPISLRDINTLKRVYEQPTRLGWPLLP